MQKQFKKGLRRQIPVTILMALLLFAVHVRSDTPWEDISAKLSIEIGNGNEDFADEAETIEKGHIVTYKLEITNNGTDTHLGLMALFEAPDYMKYIEGSTSFKSDMADPNAQFVPLPDVNGESALAMGSSIESLLTGATAVFEVEYQVEVPNDVKDDPIYTLAWVNVLGKYSVVPTVSNLIETRISGEPKVSLNVVPEPDPPVGQSVKGGDGIRYQYKLENVGGLEANGINLKTYLPAHTTCVQDCEDHPVNSLAPNQNVPVIMRVQVNTDLVGVTEITNTGYDLSANGIAPDLNRVPIIHPIGIGTDSEEGDFTVTIRQEPNIILNSANGASRPDKGDLTETVYELFYRGRHLPNTFPSINGAESQTHTFGCYMYTYPQSWGANTYAYNSTGGGCEDIYQCSPESTSIQFSVSTALPENAPRLEFSGGATSNVKPFVYGQSTNEINSYMKEGLTFTLPRIFNESWAKENGSSGIVNVDVNALVTEEYYQYQDSGAEEYLGDCSCGEDCSYPVYRPIYIWKWIPQTPIKLIDKDTADIDVYTSTAWLKTEGGHIGTNDRFTNDQFTIANIVDLGTGPGMKPDFPTPSANYTPPGETNSQYMIFGKNGTGAMVSDQENAEDWLQTGTEFPFLEEGEAYDRQNNARNYTTDLLDKQKYGEVRTDKLSSVLTGIVDIGDDLIWEQTGDLTIGEVGGEVVFSGGQSRIYVAGDVYIKSNIRLESSSGRSYNDITSLRIDARNIFVDGSVTNLEVMLLARGDFRSGVSKNQLRVLGDVIAKNAYWEREPLLEIDPTEFNKPSEYIIEDMRKYVVPVPGDTTVPDDYNIWRQVNPATGETLDAY